MAEPLKLTGERTLPDIEHENYWYTRHVFAYAEAARMAEGLTVIDTGCGEGYGPWMLALRAKSVLGIDIAPDVVEHARSKYRAGNLSFQTCDINSIVAGYGSFDLAVSLQVLEHVADPWSYLGEVSRVLTDNGGLFLTTPNRLTISPGSDGPINPFHFREYTPDELSEELSAHFLEVRILGVFHRGWLGLCDRLKVIDFIKYYSMSPVNPRYWTHRLLVGRVRPSDFTLSTEKLNRCLDVVAVCSRPVRPRMGDRRERPRGGETA